MKTQTPQAMEKQVTTQNHFKTIEFQGEKIDLPLNVFQDLPKTLSISISEPIFKKSGERQLEVVNKIIAILNIKFSTDQEQEEISALWIANAQEYRLTPKEMVQAYQYAINQKIVSKNGNPIKIYPNLSIITQAEIFKAYERFKNIDIAHQNGIKYLKSMRQKTIEKTPQQIEEDSKIFFQDEYRYYLAHGEVQTPTILFDLLIKKYKTINCSSVLSILNSYRPKAKNDKMLSRFATYNPAIHFVKTAVEGTIKKEKLMELTIDEWTNYFLSLKEL